MPVPTYTSSDKVASLLGLSSFTAGDFPSGVSTEAATGDVELYINWAEDEIDRRTGHSWRAIKVVDEYHDLDQRQVRHHFRHHLEIPIYLRHREIRAFVSGTDLIELWNGNAYDDLVSDTSFEEDRARDYWIDFEEGIIYLIGLWPVFRKNGVRITYTYGASTVPADIEEACTLMAAGYLLTNDDYSDLFPEGTTNIELSSKAEMFKTRADDILRRRENFFFL